MMMMMQARKQSNDVSGVEKNMKTKKKIWNGNFGQTKLLDRNKIWKKMKKNISHASEYTQTLS